VIELIWKGKTNFKKGKTEPTKEIPLEQRYKVDCCINRIKKNAKSNNKFYCVMPTYVYNYIIAMGINAKIEVLQKDILDNACWVEISKCK